MVRTILNFCDSRNLHHSLLLLIFFPFFAPLQKRLYSFHPKIWGGFKIHHTSEFNQRAPSAHCFRRFRLAIARWTDGHDSEDWENPWSENLFCWKWCFWRSQQFVLDSKSKLLENKNYTPMAFFQALIGYNTLTWYAQSFSLWSDRKNSQETFWLRKCLR